MKNRFNIGLVAIAAGIMALGLCLRSGINNYTYRDRTISSRGVAEREVTANVGSTDARFEIQDNDLRAIKDKALYYTIIIRQFASKNGIADSCISQIVPCIYANPTLYDGKAPQFKYSASAGISIYTEDVVALDKFCNSLYELTEQGLIVEAYPSFDYTLLNDIKPEMISTATKNARIAADQFAKDSGSSIGSIKSATQGYFSIESINGRARYYKNIRVVTSVEFYLND